MRFQTFIAPCSIIIALTSCTKTRLEQALCASGSHRQELEKVLTYYSHNLGDSLKWQAACYLIENMPSHISRTNETYASYCHSIDNLDWQPEKAAFAKLIPLYSLHSFIGDTQTVEDIRQISSNYLIQHIDYVFKLRDSLPWVKELSFEDFCEYMLPYRISDEVPIDWEATGRTLKKQVNLTDFDDLKYSVDFLTSELTEKLKLQQTYSIILPQIGTHNFDCIDEAYRKLLYYKLLGIPVSLDYVPYWSNADGGHYWAAPFDPLQKSHSDYWELKYRAPKIYRKSFRKQIHSDLPEDEYIPTFFRENRYRDVTDEYIKTSDVKIDIPPKTKTRYQYLAVFNSRAWQPVAQSRKGVFRKMGRETVYLPVAYTKIGQQILSYPFILDAYGDVTILKPDSNKCHSMNLQRKFPYGSRKEIFNYWGEGTVILGANDSLFQKHDTIHVIEGNTGMGYHHWHIAPTKSYRYIRIAPTRYIEIAELDLYDCNGEKLPVKLNGMDKNLQAATDGNILTYSTIRWGADINLGKSTVLREIRYLGRNDGNNVFAGDEYELLYMDKNGWVSAGKKKATGETITFEQVPSGALYWLRNRSRGKEERIFTYTDGHVRFW